MVGPDEAGELQSYFGTRNPRMEWVFPLDVSSLDGQQVQPLSDALDKIGTDTPALSGPLAPVASTLTVSSSMLPALNAFIATAQSVDALLWLLYVSLTVAGLAVLLVAARMVAIRRSPEITVIRARGGSLRQIAIGTGRDAALRCVPAAVLAAVLAIIVVPGAGFAQGAGSAGGWWPPIAVVAVAVVGPALIAAWQHRLPRRRTAVPRLPRGGTRLVIEAALVAAAVGGHRRLPRPGRAGRLGREPLHQLRAGTGGHPGGDRGAPAVPAGAARTACAPARAPPARPRSSASPGRQGPRLTPALPAFALVLALTVAAFAGMVRDAVANGQVAASWQTAGADATVTPSYTAQSFTISPAAARAVAAVPGVTHAAEVLNEFLDHPGRPPGQRSGRGSRQLRRACRPHPGVPAGGGRAAGGAGQAGAPQPVLVSPQAAALLGAPGQGSGAVTLSTRQAALRPVQVRVAGVISSTPAAARRRRVRDHAPGRDQVHGHAAGGDPRQ